MPNIYTTTVTNESSNTQKYALFNELPKVSATVQPEIWNNALKVTPVGPGGSAIFTITEQKDLQGNETKGITLNIDVIGEAPQFTGKATASGKLNAFGNTTAPGTKDNGFTLAKAKQNKWAIGLGKVVNRIVAAAIIIPQRIIPQPGCKYQIKPVNTWYITYGDFRGGQVVNIEMIGSERATIPFNKNSSSDVRVIHNDSGQITAQT
ncbi:hypothetical protein B0T10DRAFT_608779 [Thelonectria olida]|uniref:Uncharacterized protein n=1 Tax=Thelonectria olida TaxID=1576542 RepID=A0A9P9APD3_9HYPO|nr:hypothetical protein B0T10DRAFT_608779 [Thelonectria olida]